MSLISEKEIKRECTIPVTFNRGKNLYEEDSVLSLLMVRSKAAMAIRYIIQV